METTNHSKVYTHIPCQHPRLIGNHQTPVTPADIVDIAEAAIGEGSVCLSFHDLVSGVRTHNVTFDGVGTYNLISV